MPACVRTVPVATSAELQAKLVAAQAGDCLVLADGHYSVGMVTAKGRAAAPIVVRAANRLRAVVDSGTLTIKSSAYLVFEGLDWTSGGGIDVSSCDHCRFTRNHFHLTETGNLDWIVLRGSQWARIDHNELGPKPHPGNAISVFGTSTVAQHTRIDHNYLHDFAGGTFPAGGCDKNPGGEAMRLGVSTYEAQSAFTIVEHNLFERCHGDPETISSKSSDNVIRYNTLRGSAGTISLRAGNRGRVCGNYVVGAGQICAGGIRLCGDDHQVFDNHVEGVPELAMQLHPGDKDHATVRRALVVGNTFLGINQAMQVGSDAASTTIANNILESTNGGVVGAAAVPPGLTVTANLAHLLGRATLGVKGAPWTAGITTGDPQMVKKGEVFVLGAGSSAVDRGAPFSFLTIDIEGQARDDKPDIGADELSTAPALRGPLTPADVGPSAP